MLSPILVLFLSLQLTGLGEGHEGHHEETPESKIAVTKIREKIARNQWEVSDLVDMDHLKAELRDVIQMQEKGELTPEEASVYLFRTHDFDQNSFLDGLELSTILRHSIGENASDELVEKAVDGTMEMDTNNDGFISYPELKFQLEKQKKPPVQKDQDL